ncbi:hypothetical protein ACFX1S_023587 [Malus domestica]
MTYIRGQAHGFHLVSEEESVLQARPFEGAQYERPEGVLIGLDAVEHHILVRIPQQEMLPLSGEGIEDAVILRQVVGVVPLRVFLRLHRREVPPSQGSQRRPTLTCSSVI